MAITTTSSDIIVRNEETVPSPNLDETRELIVDLYNGIGDTYERFINAGRLAEAASLRDAAERLSRSGTDIGLSGYARTQAIKEIQDKMRVSGMQAESKKESDKVSQQLQALNSLARVDQAKFNQSMAAFSAKESQSTGSRSPIVAPRSSIRSRRSSSKSPTARRDPFADSRAQRDARQARRHELKKMATQQEYGLDRMRLANSFRDTSGSGMSPIRPTFNKSPSVASATPQPQGFTAPGRPLTPQPQGFTAPGSPLTPAASRLFSGGYAGTSGGYASQPDAPIKSPLSNQSQIYTSPKAVGKYTVNPFTKKKKWTMKGI